MDYIKWGLFLIKKKLGLVTYELELSKETRVYLVFHTVLLEKAPKDVQCTIGQYLINKEEDDFYKVEKILDY